MPTSKPTEPIECVAKRYRDWKRWVAAQKAEGFKGILFPYGGCSEDGLACAAHLIKIIEGSNPAAAIVEFAAAVETATYT